MDKRIEQLLKRVEEGLDSQVELNTNQINFIDELRILKNKNIRENAHSRILNRLLNYKKGSRFPIYDSFIQEIKIKEPQKNNWVEVIQPNNPVISTEVGFDYGNSFRGSIDVLVEDKGDENNKYAIIIENKANEAGDQEKQIKRYIMREIREGFAEDHIFVLYLPREEGGEPAEQSWGDYTRFKDDRYISFSYEKSFIPWLDKVLNIDCLENDNLTKSGIIQYKDYLDRWLKGEDKKSTIRKNIIANQLYSNGITLSGKLALLAEYSRLIRGLSKREKKKFEEWSDINKDLGSVIGDELKVLLKNDFKFYNNTTCRGRKVYLGCSFSYHNAEFYLYVGANNSGLFCSVLSKQAGQYVNGEIRNVLHNLMPLQKANEYIYDGYDETYNFAPKIEVFISALGLIREMLTPKKGES